MALLVFTAVFAFLGHGLSELFWHSRATAPLSWQERVTSSATTASALILAVTWSLALAGRLTLAWLLGSCAVALIAALLVPRRSTPAEERPPASDPTIRTTILAIVFAPLAFWLAFLLFRGYVTPVLSHDALVYHLPRAAMFAKTAGYHDFHFPDDRVDALPANYELLLADIIIMGHGDTVTEWLSTLCFALLLIAAAAMAKRWWGGGRHVYAVVLTLCTAPLLLLQAGAVKNDLMVGYYVVAALLFTGRWLTSRELPSAVLAVIACTASIGTKPSALMIALALAPILIAGAIRARREQRFGIRQITALVLVAAASIALLGGFFYLHIFAHRQGSTAQGAANVAMQKGYGEWNYVWQVPAFMFLAPFSSDDKSAPAPWAHGTWWSPRWDVHDSNFGAVISILFLMLPWVMWKGRGSPEPLLAAERTPLIIAAFLAVAATLPRRLAIYGAVSGYPRYFLFIAVVIVCAVIPPFYKLLERSTRPVLMTIGVLALTAMAFVDAAAGVVLYDTFTPLGRVLWAARHDGSRGVVLYTRRGPAVLDALAGPTDSVDVYCTWDAWIYPAMGPTYQRDLHFIHGLAEIRPQAQWVLVDAQLNWGNPNFTNIADWNRYMGHGGPQPVETAFIQAMGGDPRFEPVYVDLHGVQAVFHRRSAP